MIAVIRWLKSGFLMIATIAELLFPAIAGIVAIIWKLSFRSKSVKTLQTQTSLTKNNQSNEVERTSLKTTVLRPKMIGRY